MDLAFQSDEDWLLDIQRKLYQWSVKLHGNSGKNC